MSETETDLARIGGAIDANGDEVPQDHPIENPGDDGEGDDDDPIGEPHPDEPGNPEGKQPPSQPGER